jgi:peptide/nickel transport system ATP-binding protein
MALLEVSHLSVVLDTQRGPAQAIRDVSFSVDKADTLGIVGESGSGKSMTVMAIMGLLPEGAKVEGSIRFAGEELTTKSDREMGAIRGDRIGMIFQEPMTALNPVHTIGKQVAEPLRLHRGVDARAAKKRAIELLERVGIPDAPRRFDAYPHQFSGGQRQRITIAMALACEPQLLIADEPTTALDVTIQKQILELIAGIVAERRMTLMLISHDLGVIAQNASRMLVMYGGSVVEDGPTRSVFADRMHPYTIGLFGARPSLHKAPGSKLVTIPGTVPELADLPRGCPFAGRCPFTIPECQSTVPPPYEVDAGHHVRCIRLDAVAESKKQAA